MTFVSDAGKDAGPSPAERNLGPRSLKTGPEQALMWFGAALGDGDLPSATACFTRDACFVTPDSTIVQGREQIRDILSQLIGMGLRLCVEPRGMLTIGDVALGRDNMAMRFGGHRRAVDHSPRAAVILRRTEGEWKLLFAAPWGWP